MFVKSRRRLYGDYLAVKDYSDHPQATHLIYRLTNIAPLTPILLLSNIIQSKRDSSTWPKFWWWWWKAKHNLYLPKSIPAVIFDQFVSNVNCCMKSVQRSRYVSPVLTPSLQWCWCVGGPEHCRGITLLHLSQRPLHVLLLI